MYLVKIIRIIKWTWFIVGIDGYTKIYILQDKAVEIVAQHMCTDLPDSFGQSFLGLCGYSMTKRAAQQCYQDACMSARDIDLFEVHDCFAPNEVRFT